MTSSNDKSKMFTAQRQARRRLTPGEQAMGVKLSDKTGVPDDGNPVTSLDDITQPNPSAFGGKLQQERNVLAAHQAQAEQEIANARIAQQQADAAGGDA